MNPQPAVPEYVRAGERVLWMGKPTLLVLVGNALGMIVFLAFGGIFFVGSLLQEGGNSAILVGIAAFLVLTTLFVLNAMRLRRTQYVITDQSIYTRTGLVGQSVIQTTYDKITDIALRQDVVGRLFGYSTLQVNTAGSNTAPVQMTGLPRALSVKQTIEQARETLLERGRTRGQALSWEPVTTSLPRFTLDRDIMLVACTTTRKPFKRPRSDAGKRVACPHCTSQHVAKEAARGRTPG